VVKPLYWFGGRFIEKIDNRSQAKEIIEKALVLHQYILIQKFLPEIYDGDKRVTIIDGRVAAVMRRKPAEGSFISNLAAGGTAHTAELTSRELHIAETLALYLKQQGIIFAGVDMIGEHLIEINVTSPTGLIAIEKLYGLNLAEDIVSAIYTRFI
jgi:glutathione synthase